MERALVCVCAVADASGGNGAAGQFEAAGAEGVASFGADQVSCQSWREAAAQNGCSLLPAGLQPRL